MNPPRSATALLLALLCATLQARCAEIAARSPALSSNLPPHPRLLLDSNGVRQLQVRVATEGWAKRSWAELQSQAEAELRDPVLLPPRGGNWSHNYVCPTHGARLRRGRELGPWKWEHICPVGDHRLRGDPSQAALDFDGNAISGAHGNLAEAVVRHGLVFQVTGNRQHASRAREILLAYSGQYTNYPLHDNQGKPGRGGRVASQSLTEASWLIDIAQGADLIWPTLAAQDRNTIKNKLLLPALNEVILPRRLGIHNIQCRHNSAIGLVGLLLGDTNLVAIAVDDPAMGFRQQLNKGVLDDGLWLEGSSGYHFFTINGLWPLAEAARNCGIDLYGPKFKAMFDGPLAMAMPDFVLPNFNDSGTVPLRSQADLYELALARFGSPQYADLLRTSERRGRLALLFGTANLPAPSTTAGLRSRNLTASGYAILQQGEGPDATWLALKYGPHGGGHGHPDKNSFILYSRRQILVTDAGTHAYGSALHRDWDKTTLAHNTLTVDENSQAPATGKCLAFGADKEVDFAVTDAGPIFSGVRYTRTVAMLTPDLILFIDQVKADRPQLLDIACHAIGEWVEPAAGEPWKVPRAPGYSRLTELTTRSLDMGQLAFALKTEDGRRNYLIVAANQPTQIISGLGMLKTTEDKVPVLLQRRRTSETAFVWVISLNDSMPTVQTTTAKNAAGDVLPLSDASVVAVASGARRWRLAVNPQRNDLRVVSNQGQEWSTSAPFAVLER